MINRNNYEEYFLLLADNELSPEEATTVKQFAAQFPDLAEELDLLMSCRLDVVPMPVFPKEKLLRTTLWNTDNIDPVHTQMLLLLDGELSATEQQQLQQQITESTALQNDWASLQQTKLTPATIAHPDKESLHYNDRKVRPLLWMRWAAAAVIAGLGWFIWMQQKPQVEAPSNTLAGVIKPEQEVSKKTHPQNSTLSQPAHNDAQSAQTQQVAATTPNTHPRSTNRQTNHQPDESMINLVTNSSVTPSNATPESTITETEPVVAQLSSTDVSIASNKADKDVQVAHLSTKVVALPMLTTVHKTDAFTGNTNELTDEENDYVRVGGARINKQKMRGLFRNVTRTVTRSFSKSKIEPDVYATR